MNRAELAGYELLAMDELAAMDSPLHRAGPLAKFMMTIAYILITVSFHRYEITGLFAMLLFVVVGYQISGIRVRSCFYRLRIVMPLVCIVGIFNPFFDKEIVMTIGSTGISGGVISMLVLMLKGVFCLMASFLLIATTQIEAVCVALRRLYVPRTMTSLILLTYRYISVLLTETGQLITAYHLRAPGQKGVHVKFWGTFLGQLLLRSMDRAENLYDSMLLRGYSGDLPDPYGSRNVISGIIALVVIGLMVVVRIYNIPVLLGSLFS